MSEFTCSGVIMAYSRGYTPVHWAVQHGNYEAVRYMLKDDVCIVTTHTHTHTHV